MTESHVSLYTPRLLAQLPPGSQDSHLAWLCRKDSDSGAAETAALIETWVQRYSPPVDTRQQLVSADVANFWSALGELTVAATLDDLGFTVNMRPQFPRPGKKPLTPDILATKNGERLIVEVFSKSNDKKSEDERALLDRVAQELQPRLNLPENGFLTMTALPSGGDRTVRHPGEAGLEDVAGRINLWLRSFSEGSFRFEQGIFPVSGTLMPGDGRDLVITPLGGALNQGPRIGRDIVSKVEKYAPFVDADTRFSVAIVAGGWKITERQAETAMFGGQELLLSRESGDVLAEVYNGQGAAVVGGPFDSGVADALSGAWYLERRGDFEGDPPGVMTHVSFMHNPFARFTLAPEDVGLPRQLIARDLGTFWQGARADAVRRLH